MDSLPVTTARSNLYALVAQVASSHEPIEITGKEGSVVLLSKDDWRAVEATLQLLSVPGMRASIKRGLTTPLSRTFRRPGW